MIIFLSVEVKIAKSVLDKIVFTVITIAVGKLKIEKSYVIINLNRKIDTFN